MIRLFNHQRRPVGAYRTFEDVCDYFRRLEYFKDYGDSSQTHFGQGCWGFMYHSHKRLSMICDSINGEGADEPGQEAYENGFDLIEIATGAPPWGTRQFIVAHELDITGLMREWCFCYAHAHNFTLLEVLDLLSSGLPSSARKNIMVHWNDQGCWDGVF